MTFLKGYIPYNKGKKRPGIGGAKKGDGHWNWKGGKTIRKGYVLILAPWHPKSFGRGYYSEHRLVMEKHLGRMLTNEEVVHHINRNRADNRIENLQIIPRKGGAILNAECPECHYRFSIK